MLFTYGLSLHRIYTLVFIVCMYVFFFPLRRLCDKLCGAFSLVFLFPLYFFCAFFFFVEGCECLLKVCTTKPFAIVIGSDGDGGCISGGVGAGDGGSVRSNGCFPYPFVYCLIAFYFLFA